MAFHKFWRKRLRHPTNLTWESNPIEKNQRSISKINFGKNWKFAFFFIFRRCTENGPSHIYERWKKKLKNKEVRLMKINQKTLLLWARRMRTVSVLVANALISCSSSYENISYIFLRHSNPLWKTKWFLNESLRGQRDYCIHIYTILMQILDKANPT